MFDLNNHWILHVVFRHEERYRKTFFLQDLLIITNNNFYKLTFMVDVLLQSSNSHDWITVSCTSISIILFIFEVLFIFYLFSASSFSLHPSQYLPMDLGYGGFT